MAQEVAGQAFQICLTCLNASYLLVSLTFILIVLFIVILQNMFHPALI